MQTSSSLPTPLARYFANETEAVACWFTEDAIVIDEHNEHRGRVAIAAWNAASHAKYRVTAEPVGSSTEGDVLTMRARVTGTFPGSPVELQLGFTIEGGLISRLEVVP